MPEVLVDLRGGLLDELGLTDRLRWNVTRTGFYTDGRLYSLSNAVEFLRFPPLSLIDKARLALTILHASRLKDWQRLEQIPVTTWLERWSGARTFQRIWLPLLKSKLGENYRLASAAISEPRCKGPVGEGAKRPRYRGFVRDTRCIPDFTRREAGTRRANLARRVPA